MTREVFDALIIGVIIVGLALAVVRLYQDFTRPLPDDDVPRYDWRDDADSLEDTQQNIPTSGENNP